MANGITETIGLDMGDRYTRYSILDQESGEEVGSGRVRTTPGGLERFLEHYPRARVVLEVGTHSRWASQVARDHCAEILVANPRKLSFIYQNNRKSDEVDAAALARVGRMDPKLLSPIRHRSAKAQADLAILRARAGLVSARTKLVNTLRGIVKSFGGRIPPQATNRIGHRTLPFVPGELKPALGPILLAIEALTDEIAEYDARIDALADEKYPEARCLTQVRGVGNLTALAFLLTIEDPSRFRRSRTAGAYLGLVPRRDQSGDTEKQLSITKAGDRMVRTLLVQCAHRVLAKNGPDSDLRRAGERIASRGGRTAKRRAVIAVARKLAVLLHALWRSGEVYEPLRNNQVQSA
jgi:transposase